MIVNLYRFLCRISPKLKVLIWKQWYQLISKYYKRKEWTFMNYGYAPIGNQTESIEVEEKDPDQFCKQLYHHVVGNVDLKGMSVLEVGSGRGGGSHYMNNHFKPDKMVGVDFSENAVNLCNKNYTLNGLSFEVGDAELLPFSDSSFDVIVNVESSHCYNSVDNFLGQVKRVLRKGGYFLFTDFRRKEDMGALLESLNNSGLTLIKETDITHNVVEALKLDNENKIALIHKTIHKSLVKPFLQFSGVKGSKIYENLKNRDNIYQSFVFQKTS